LEEIDKLKDDFLANTSHELRTPLHGIIGIAESIIEGAAGKVSNAARANLKMVVQSGKRLAALINDILDFSKIKHQDLALQLKSVDLRSIAEVTLVLSKPLLGKKQLNLENNIPDDLPYVSADENRLHQIFFNLVGNAIKFTEKGTVKITAHQEGSMIIVSISDTGIGIPESKQEQIFRHFEQADGAIAREYGGTGIGLSLTRKLIELHAGNIRVESAVGEGSSFIFSLPISDKKPADLPISNPVSNVIHMDDFLEQQPDPVKEDLMQMGKYRILAIDDESINLQVIKNHLSLKNYQVFRAATGEEALALLDSEEKFDLVLLDLMMPKMSGFEVCKKIRQTYSQSELPIIIVTAKNQIGDLVESLDSGANDYLTKPFSSQELVARTESHIKLAELYKKVMNFNTELEHKVQQRTKELNKTLDQLSQAKEVAETANQLKKEFLSIVSHDLKTPISGILTFSSLLLQNADNPLNVQASAQSIAEFARQMSVIIGNLLDVNRLERNEYELFPGRVDLYDVLGKIIERFEYVAFEKQIRINLSEKSRDIFIYADETATNQIFDNLISNAMKFSEKNTTIDIRLEENGESIVCFVEDQGQGLTADDMKKLFIKFERLSAQATAGESSIGLGLAIVKRLTELLGGTVRAESKGKGHGSQFIVNLPIFSGQAFLVR